MILDQKHARFQKLCRQFAETEFTKELLDKLEETGDFDWDIFKKMAKYGFCGVKIPKEYGGAGGDYLSYAILVEEFARVSPVLSIYANTSNSLGGGPLMLAGSEEQKQKYLPPVARGEQIMSFALTEPGAGSDAGGATTRAVEQEDGSFILNGRKTFISGAPMSDYCIVFAKTDPSQKGSRGISMFVLDMHLPGVSLGKPEHKMGIKGYPTCDVIMEDVHVPADALVGKKDKGFGYAMQTLDGGRLGMAAQGVGIAQGCLEEAVKYAKERKQFGRPIANFQAISFMLADMATETEAARQLVYHAAELKDAGKDAGMACSMAKYFAAEAANHVAYKAVQIHGGYGYISEYKVERFYRDARIVPIYEGTSQVQQMVISGMLLK